MQLLSDGQHHLNAERQKCFFCVQERTNCKIVWVDERDNAPPPEYQVLYKKRFVICPECSAKGNHYIAGHLKNWIQTQKILNHFLPTRRKRR